MSYARKLIKVQIQTHEKLLEYWRHREAILNEHPDVEQDINDRFTKMEIDVMTGEAPPTIAKFLDQLRGVEDKEEDSFGG